MAEHGFDHHDHNHCISTGLEVAEKHCADAGVRLTPVRRRVLEILLQEHRAMGAYDILPILAQEGLGSQPPVVYRALEFLQANKLVHKVERLNAFIACSHPGSDHVPAFMICRDCSKVVETQGSTAAGLTAAAQDVGFSVEATVIEAEGLCPNCQPSA
ncbi:MAG: transcriptional repressor [Cognatishimia sp.]|uniref:Fur family transcriptional regulator n=1 Tax=Cognatishimia sp. TaxID=2211648 RepID=UPI003B8CCD33